MAIIKTTLNVRPNNGAADNKLITPTGGDVHIEINRGFNTVIPTYGIAICTRDAAGNLKVEKTLETDGEFPPAGNPNAQAPHYLLGAPNNLLNRVIVVVSSAVAVGGVAGSIAVIVNFLQKNADNPYRRVDWEDDEATQAVQLQSRFEVDILP